MSWSLEASPEFDRDFRKLRRKNSTMERAVKKKVAQILEAPLHDKRLRTPLVGVRRVHVEGSFVLLFEAIEARRVVRLLGLAHHDEAYGI